MSLKASEMAPSPSQKNGKDSSISSPELKSPGIGSGRPKRKVEVVKDGGWGWMVVLGSCICHFFLIGINRSMGIVYLSIQEKFNATGKQTALVASIFVSIRALGGPVASKMCDRFGCRAVTVTGGILLCLGLVLSAFAFNLINVYLAFGIVAGLGGVMVFSPSYIAVTYWFDKKKGKAMAFSTLGTGFGSIVMAPTVMALVSNYGYFGTMLITGALLLNNSVGGALYRKPSKNKEMLDVIVEEKAQSEETGKGEKLRKKDENDASWKEETVESLVQTMEPDTNGKAEKFGEVTRGEKVEHSLETTKIINTTMPQGHQIQIRKPNSDKLDLNSVEVTSTKSPAQTRFPRDASTLTETTFQCGKTISDASTEEDCVESSPASAAIEMASASSDAAKGQSSTPDAPINSHGTGSVKKSSKKQTSDLEKKDLPALESPDESSANDRRSLPMRLCFRFRSSLFFNVPFILYSALVMAVQGCIQSVLIFLPGRGRELGYSHEQASLLVVMFGVSDMIGRFIFGFIFDIKVLRTRRTHLYTAVAATFGVFTIILGYMPSYVSIATATVLVALFEGGAHSQRATNVTELVKPSQMSIGVGLVIFFQGIGNFYGPLVGGALKDLTGSFSSSFIFGGSTLLLICILTALHSFIQHRASSKRKARENVLPLAKL